MTQPKLILDGVKMKKIVSMSETKNIRQALQWARGSVPITLMVESWNIFEKKRAGYESSQEQRQLNGISTLDMDGHVEAVQNNLQWDLAYQMANVIFVPCFDWKMIISLIVLRSRKLLY